MASPFRGDGVRGFVADLAAYGTTATVEGPSVVYGVIAPAGAHVGALVPTAVSVSELGGWPAVPPHWVHFPDHVQFASTNSDRHDALPGWQRHSRDIQRWDMSTHPGQAWLAHVRSVLMRAV